MDLLITFVDYSVELLFAWLSLAEFWLFDHDALVAFCLYTVQPAWPFISYAYEMPCHSRTVRSSAALALGKLSALSTRVDPLVGDLLSSLQVILVPFGLFTYLIL